jgi:hypothetical protein
MSRYLVVAHSTVTNPRLLEQLRTMTKDDPQAEFVLLVPATAVRHLPFRSREQEPELAARKLANRARAMFTKKGLNLVDARVGAESPIAAIDEEVQAHPDYAGFVISTLPQETSRWLRLDLPQAVRSRYRQPVHHVQAPPDWTAGDLP